MSEFRSRTAETYSADCIRKAATSESLVKTSRGGSIYSEEGKTESAERATSQRARMTAGKSQFWHILRISSGGKAAKSWGCKTPAAARIWHTSNRAPHPKEDSNRQRYARTSHSRKSGGAEAAKAFLTNLANRQYSRRGKCESRSRARVVLIGLVVTVEMDARFHTTPYSAMIA